MVAIRISICVQLGCLVFFATSIGLTVIALATWYTNHKFVKNVRSDALMLSASLKSAQLSSNLLLMQILVRQATLRLSPQAALELYYGEGSSTWDLWNRTAEDYDAIFAGNTNSRMAVQARIYHKEGTNTILFSRTAVSVTNTTLPYKTPAGEPAHIGDSLYGFIPELYPQFNVQAIDRTSDQYEAEYQGRTINRTTPLLSGPYKVDDHLTLLSITMPITNKTSNTRIMGWLTVALDARLISEVLDSREGLGARGISLLIGPYNVTNTFPPSYLFHTPNANAPHNYDVQYQFSPGRSRDAQRVYQYGTAPPFDWAQYPAVRDGFSSATGNNNNAGSALSTRNEKLHGVSMGRAIVNSSMVDWMLVVERPHAEIWAPINRLRRVILSCVFGTMAAMLAVTFPTAHYLSRPVRRLRDATGTTVVPQFPKGTVPRGQVAPGNEASDSISFLKENLPSRVGQYEKLNAIQHDQRREADERRQFTIPSKVKDGRHVIHDELTELTETFNKMVVELVTGYEELEERVQQRTAELELSKEVAEAANRSKTLFIANISHELKTPLNGIMGMLAVCMSEDNSPRLKQSLEIIYKSGDLLSNLLTDLLTFSEIQVGQHSSLDEKEFRLRDIGTQILAIFGQQAEAAGNTLSIKFESPHVTETDKEGHAHKRSMVTSLGSEPLEDVLLYGDEHLILRVILNLVSNSLKFTSAGGTVIVTIRCNGELDTSKCGNVSIPSRHNSSLGPRSRLRGSTSASESTFTPHLATVSSTSLSRPNLEHRRVVTKPIPEQWLSFEFEVQDTGVGIPEHLHSKIFEPFIQGDLSLNKKYSGAGLGLSICARLASLLKGTMGMKSQVGQGSTFVMSIPLRRGISHAGSLTGSGFDLPMLILPVPSETVEKSHTVWSPRSTQSNRQIHLSPTSIEIDSPAQTSPVTTALDAVPEGRTAALGRDSLTPTLFSELTRPLVAAGQRRTQHTMGSHVGIKVLVAEDNKTNQEVIRRMLELEGLQNITVAIDGQDAVDKVNESVQRHDPYNLVFMDIQMPNLDGLQATILIRQSGFNAPIVALTAYTDQANMKECLDSGMDAFLSKPIRRPALRNVLRQYFPIEM
ncbi:hypothetical protein C7974DRAFT_300513 [Boeremia exigua]|uniref:uncharacterized protein n=1 Tax=Boeremia exigua TaxID=749465 RepID=UPI001E8CA6BD|nr:uncharacterized protein C7974DRAFT_300513 [Boeremia exigua]KAH6644458.1 hypothetical protein C7974DRAFT_300513 [Boeremia exigua]